MKKVRRDVINEENTEKKGKEGYNDENDDDLEEGADEAEDEEEPRLRVAERIEDAKHNKLDKLL